MVLVVLVAVFSVLGAGGAGGARGCWWYFGFGVLKGLKSNCALARQKTFLFLNTLKPFKTFRLRKVLDLKEIQAYKLLSLP